MEKYLQIAPDKIYLYLIITKTFREDAKTCWSDHG